MPCGRGDVVVQVLQNEPSVVVIVQVLQNETSVVVIVQVLQNEPSVCVFSGAYSVVRIQWCAFSGVFDSDLNMFQPHSL